ncbi:hypothetical protein MVEN_02251000 [Mycena venus]|uniref:Uncharacterized protein n=1 Tax=Mycena venus TaxID=2733690 RepID=A0A8H7CGX2_9AGAR|nr:hypothetical protein MVEN_02251000 [Mycena venus]
MVFSKPCSFESPTECVTIFGAENCSEGNFILNYTPTCAGNCYQYSSFDSITVQGNTIDSTNCYVYSDINCKDLILETGDHQDTTCFNTPGAQSMICYFDC